MAVPFDLQVRVDRFLAGERRVDDLSRIFLWLRERTRGHADLVRDVGDFEAHRDRRDQGLTWSHATDYCAMMDRLYASEVQPFHLTKEVLVKSLLAAARNINRQRLEYETGFKARKNDGQLAAVVKRIANKTLHIADDEAVFPEGALDQREAAIFSVLKRQIAIPVVITQDGLAEQFGSLLIDEGLVQDDDMERVHKNSDFLILFAISRMHHASIRVPNGKRAWFEAGIASAHPRTLAVNLVYSIDDRMHPTIRVCQTNETASHYIDPRLAVQQTPYGPSTPRWDIPVDFNAEGKLAPLTDKPAEWSELGTV